MYTARAALRAGAAAAAASCAPVAPAAWAGARRLLSSASASAPSAAARHVVKRTTGIVGLDVEPNARDVLVDLYGKTLRDVATLLPPEVAYRAAVEKFTRFRLDVCLATDDIAEIEARIGRGQVEELIEQAKSELQLIPQYASWRLWEAKQTKEDESGDTLYEQIAAAGPDGEEKLKGPLRDLALAKKRELQARETAAAKAAADAVTAKAKAAAAPPAAAPAAAPAKKA